MADFIMLLTFAIFGIIGYGVMVLIDRSFDRHTSDSEKTERETKANEPAEAGESERAYSCMSVFLHLQRKGHTRSFQNHCGFSRNADRPVR